MLKGRSLLEPMDFSLEELDGIFDLADRIIADPQKYAHACDGKLLATLFYEPSTRTRFSFEAAMLRLGGQVIGFSEPNSSSASKGETLADTVKRELQEELGISIEVGNFLTQVISDTTISNFFECKILSGTPKIGGEELERMNIDNYYEVRFIPFEKLDSLNLMPPEIKTYIIKEYLK